ncbi:MAG: DNA-3-methyladenine glycosylase [Synergistaceae bacterium]|jgi:DNA-3-methyladenine glycosylase|nr:DNA-3-methyladenine glycosylase [Synergistaceae bacterium]
MGGVLGREFYMEGAVAVARKLLGAVLVRNSPQGTASGVIVETEAYAGRDDAACHSYKRDAPASGHRTNVMFGPGGVAYVYLIYGMHCCFNVVANLPGLPEAVLIRALEPKDGIALMRERRGVPGLKNLCSGPGKLCAALGITRDLYGADLCGGEIYIERGEPVPDESALSTRRINVDYSGEASLYPYRFVIKDSGFLSTRRYVA